MDYHGLSLTTLVQFPIVHCYTKVWWGELDQLFILDNADLAAMMILHCCYVLLFILLEDKENVLFTLCKVAQGISFLNFNLSLFLQQSDRFLLVFLNMRYKEVSFIFILISKLVRTFYLITRILQSPDV